MRRAAVAWVATLILACGLLALPLVAFAATSAVNIQGFAFSPTPITIRVGDTVTWTNRDAAQHSARFPGMGTPILSQGQSGSLTFTSAGTFNYDCAVHGSAMQGSVVVQAVSTPAPTPPPTQVRTAPPTTAATVPPTAATTEAPTAAPSVTPSATPSTAPETPSQTASPSAVAVQLTPVPTPSSGSGPLLIGAAALALVAIGAIAFFLLRRP